VFVSKGSLNNNLFFATQCAPVFYRTHNLHSDCCQQHWNPVCIVCEFLVEVTPENNAYCRSWSGFTGKKLVHSCHVTADDNCADCRTGHIWTNSHGEACHTGCVFGLVMNHHTQVCETCTQRCPVGYSFPLAA
jgi:hypothetical protein